MAWAPTAPGLLMTRPHSSDVSSVCQGLISGHFCVRAVVHKWTPKKIRRDSVELSNTPEFSALAHCCCCVVCVLVFIYTIHRLWMAFELAGSHWERTMHGE